MIEVTKFILGILIIWYSIKAIFIFILFFSAGDKYEAREIIDDFSFGAIKNYKIGFIFICFVPFSVTACFAKYLFKETLQKFQALED